MFRRALVLLVAWAAILVLVSANSSVVHSQVVTNTSQVSSSVSSSDLSVASPNLQVADIHVLLLARNLERELHGPYIPGEVSAVSVIDERDYEGDVGVEIQYWPAVSNIDLSAREVAYVFWVVFMTDTQRLVDTISVDVSDFITEIPLYRAELKRDEFLKYDISEFEPAEVATLLTFSDLSGYDTLPTVFIAAMSNSSITKADLELLEIELAVTLPQMYEGHTAHVSVQEDIEDASRITALVHYVPASTDPFEMNSEAVAVLGTVKLCDWVHIVDTISVVVVDPVTEVELFSVDLDLHELRPVRSDNFSSDDVSIDFAPEAWITLTHKPAGS